MSTSQTVRVMVLCALLSGCAKEYEIPNPDLEWLDLQAAELCLSHGQGYARIVSTYPDVNLVRCSAEKRSHYWDARKVRADALEDKKRFQAESMKWNALSCGVRCSDAQEKAKEWAQ